MSFKGFKHTDAAKQKISLTGKGRKTMLGKHHSEETKQKMSEIKRGIKHPLYGKHHTEEAKKKMSKSLKGKHHTEETKRKISRARKGKKASEETRKKISKAKMGEKNPNWKGGITPKMMKIRDSIETRLWREAIYARDNWICQKCKIKGSYLHSHHIFNFADFNLLRTSIKNGITFCKECHKEFHKKYGVKNNTKKQLNEFLINN